jgi:hypothetical protein
VRKLTDPIGSLCNCIARAAVSSFANSTNAWQAKSRDQQPYPISYTKITKQASVESSSSNS